MTVDQGEAPPGGFPGRGMPNRPLRADGSSEATPRTEKQSMMPGQDQPTVAIANGYARLEGRVTAWVEDDPGALAAVVIGSRARTDHPADEWADLDLS